MTKTYSEKSKQLEKYIIEYLAKTNLHELEVFQNLDFFKRVNEQLYLKTFKHKDNEISFDLKKVSFLVMIDVIKEFYIKHGYGIDVDELINNGTIDFNYLEGELVLGGSNYYDDGSRAVDVNNNGYLIDSAILIHEISHYQNQPKSSRCETSSLLTESLAYAETFMFLDFLEEKGYAEDSSYLKKEIIKLMNNYASNLISCFKLFVIYEKFSGITRENYKLMFDDNQYEKHIDDLEQIINSKGIKLFKDMGYVLGYFLAMHMYQEYKKNASYINVIKALHIKINEVNTSECLEHIGFSSITNTLKNIEDFIDDIYNEDEEKKL